MNLLFCIDNKVLGNFVCCLKSITLHGGYGYFDVYVLHSCLTQDLCDALSKDFRRSVTFHFIQIPEKLFADFPVTNRYPKEIYFRLIAPMLLPAELDRILYLDVDTIVINPLCELYETDFEDNYYAGCSHTKYFLTRINQIRLNADKQSVYINTGVLLLNLPLLRNYLSFQKIQEYVKSNKNILVLPDQDILSALYGDKVKLLDTLRFNLSDRIMNLYNAQHIHHRIDIKWVRQNTVIIHFCGNNKPWNPGYTGKLGSIYRDLFAS